MEKRLISALIAHKRHLFGKINNASVFSRGQRLQNGTTTANASSQLLRKNEECGTVESDYTRNPQYPDHVPSIYAFNSDDTIYQARKYISDIVRDLPTVPEKIDFVNPYERNWAAVERRRHREYMRPLKRPRKAYKINPIPMSYNSLNMYQYVTNTHCVKGLPDKVYDSVSVSENELHTFTDGVLNMLKMELQGRQQLSESIDNFLEQIGDLIFKLFSDDLPHLRDTQVGFNVRCESFLERAGFRHLYADMPLTSKVRLPTDHVHKLGQMAFSFKDTTNVQFRSQLSLPPFVTPENDLCNSSHIERFVYSPMHFTDLERDVLYMTPGFEYGDPNEFGHLMFNSFKDAHKELAKWQAEPEEFDDILRCLAISTCFSWLNGQAHYKGFTQLTDIIYPFSTQSIMTDGRLWFFSCYQLNTLDLLYNFEEQFKADLDSPVVRQKDYSKPQQKADMVQLYSSSGKTRLSNVCWCDGPYELYRNFDEKSGQFSGLDNSVLEKILKFVKLAPRERSDTPPNLKPYVKIYEKDDDVAEKIIQANIEASSNIKYTV